MNYWKVILATVVIFGAGVFTGDLLVNCIDHPHSKNPHRLQPNGDTRPPENREHIETPLPPEPPSVRQMNKDFLKKLDDKLQLSSEQHSKIEKIIADGQERNHEIWRTNAGPLMRAVMMDVNRQIREQLSADQQKQFEELMRRVPRRQNPTNAPASLPTSLTGSNLSPEAQVIMIETEQLTARQRTNAANNILPPTFPAPPPAPAN